MTSEQGKFSKNINDFIYMIGLVTVFYWIVKILSWAIKIGFMIFKEGLEIDSETGFGFIILIIFSVIVYSLLKKREKNKNGKRTKR